MEHFDWGRVIGKAVGAGFLIVVIYLGIWVWGLAAKAGKKVLELRKVAIDQERDRIDGIPDGGSRYDALYSKAYTEMKEASFDVASWAKAIANSAGDDDKAKSLYIRYRVEQLKDTT